MRQTAKPTRENRTMTVAFHDETTYLSLLGNTTAFIECVLAFLLALGLQLAPEATCHGGGCLTRHAHYARVRLGGLTIWRVQCTTGHAVCTVLPPVVLRSRQRRPEGARDALRATHGGSPGACLRGLAHLYNLIPYQRRALNAGTCGVEVEGGRVPTSDWRLNLQILTSGVYRCVPAPPNH